MTHPPFGTALSIHHLAFLHTSSSSGRAGMITFRPTAHSSFQT